MKDVGHPVDATGRLVEQELLEKVIKQHGEDLVSQLLSEFRTAKTKLAGGHLSGKMGTGPEIAYARAYQSLVRIGLCSQIKRKYRKF